MAHKDRGCISFACVFVKLRKVLPVESDLMCVTELTVVRR